MARLVQELRHFWRQQGVKTGTREVCLVSVQTINKAVIWSVELCWSVLHFLYSRQICHFVLWNAQVRWRCKIRTTSVHTFDFVVCLLDFNYSSWALFTKLNSKSELSVSLTAQCLFNLLNRAKSHQWVPTCGNICGTHHKSWKDAQQRPDVGQQRTVNLVCQGLYMYQDISNY